jgi:hypothetical protein
LLSYNDSRTDNSNDNASSHHDHGDPLRCKHDVRSLCKCNPVQHVCSWSADHGSRPGHAFHLRALHWELRQLFDLGFGKVRYVHPGQRTGSRRHVRGMRRKLFDLLHEGRI